MRHMCVTAEMQFITSPKRTVTHDSVRRLWNLRLSVARSDGCQLWDVRECRWHIYLWFTSHSFMLVPFLFYDLNTCRWALFAQVSDR